MKSIQLTDLSITDTGNAATPANLSLDRFIVHKLSIRHFPHCIRYGCDLIIMGYHDDAVAQLMGKTPENGNDILCILLVQISGRFIRQQDPCRVFNTCN